MRRRLFFLLVGLGAGLCLIAVSLPWWLGSAARVFGPSRGFTFGSYERIGYARFALIDAEYRRQRVQVTASRVEIDSPLIFLANKWRGQPREIRVGAWEVNVAPASGPPSPPATTGAGSGWIPLEALLHRIAFYLDAWAPSVTAGAGMVRWPGGEIGAEKFRWQQHELAATTLRYWLLTTDAAVTFLPASAGMRLRARSADETMTLALESKGPDVTGVFGWLEQPAKVDARFGERGWLPEAATFWADAWSVPADQLKLGAFYGRVRGSAFVEWREQHVAANVTVASDPLATRSAPPLQLNFRGQGDHQAFTVESLEAQLPGIAAKLSEPVTVERSGKLSGVGARLALQANLAEQPWFVAQGTITGEAQVVSGEEPKTLPGVTFAVQGRNLQAYRLKLAEVSAGGALAWPRLQVERGIVAGDAGDKLSWHGGWDFAAKELLDAQVEGEVRRETLERWLPTQPGFELVRIKARAAGPVAAIRHEGEMQVDAVKLTKVNPISLEARWSGTGVGAERFDVAARTGAARIVASGRVDRTQLQLEALELSQADESRLKLAAPVVVQWAAGWEIKDLHLTGPQAQLTGSARFGPTGKIQLAMKDVSSAWFTDWLAEKPPAVQLQLLALSGAWDQGPMDFSLTAGASLDLGGGRMAAVNTSSRGDKAGLRIEALRATEGNDTVVNASGFLPVTITPSAPNWLNIDERGAVALDATAAPNAAFWQKLAELSGLNLEHPQAEAHVTGTWRRPQGKMTLKAARLSVDPKRVARPLPSIERIDIAVTGDRGGVTLDRFAVHVEGQPVRASGLLPIPDGSWIEVLNAPMAAVERGGNLTVEFPAADVAVFSRFLPALLAPQGRIEAKLSYKEGGVHGYVRLQDAATRPLGPLGVLQEITAELKLNGRKLTLEGVRARSGGQPLELAGTVEWPAQGQPRYDLTLKGQNLPFVRQTGLLLRGDLDLKLQTPGAAAPQLSGTVRLRDSLFLSDVRSFLPRGGAGAARRPPYFEVTTPPVNTWALAVEVSGDKFMRLRTPVFNGVTSARFKLSGTLGEPRAIGEIEIDEGSVRMPFARFDVKQGSVRLTEADPSEPTLYLRGAGRQYGYNLNVEIDGKASAPNVVFTSSPARDSEQVLLMVMTGSAPTNETTVTGTQRVTRLGTFVGQNLLNSFTSDNADADRLSITAGEKISRQGKETYDIEYKLSDRWTVRGEYNEFDEYNAALKWRVFRGEGRARDGETPKNPNADK